MNEQPIERIEPLVVVIATTSGQKRSPLPGIENDTGRRAFIYEFLSYLFIHEWLIFMIRLCLCLHLFYGY